MLTAPDFSLKGKVALITGASRGIGQAVAEAYAASGAKVVLFFALPGSVEGGFEVVYLRLQSAPTI